MLIDRVHRELTDEEITRLADTYHAWRGKKLPSPVLGRGAGVRAFGAGKYKDIPGFCKSATIDEIRQHGHVLTPGRYVGAEDVEDDGEPFGEKMQRLMAQLTSSSPSRESWKRPFARTWRAWAMAGKKAKGYQGYTQEVANLTQTVSDLDGRNLPQVVGQILGGSFLLFGLALDFGRLATDTIIFIYSPQDLPKGLLRGYFFLGRPLIAKEVTDGN